MVIIYHFKEILPPTMYKNNSQDSSKCMGCSPFQLYYNLKGIKPAIGYYSYTKC